MAENYFKKLYDIDVKDKIKEKNGLNYLSWAACWAEVKKVHPNATFRIYEMEIKITMTTESTVIERVVSRPWFDDGQTGWVKTGVTIDELEHIEELPIMDFRNKSIPADKIDSTDANKAIQRSLTKACARHGLGLYIYEGEDLPEESKELLKLRSDCLILINNRCELSETTKKKVGEICKAMLPDDNGNPNKCDDLEILRKLKKAISDIRKIADK